MLHRMDVTERERTEKEVAKVREGCCFFLILFFLRSFFLLFGTQSAFYIFLDVVFLNLNSRNFA